MNPDRLEATLEEVKKLTECTLQNLCNKWRSMYTMTEEIECQRLSQFLDHLKDFYSEMSQSEEYRKELLKKDVEKKIQECQELERALNVTVNYDDSSQRPLSEQIKHLDGVLKNFEELKTKRLKKYHSLKAKETALCALLGTKELLISSNIPTEEEINNIEHQIFLLEEEKLKRIEEYHQHRDNIIEYIEKLEISTLLDFEKSLVDTEEVISLIPGDLSRMKNIEKAYKEQFENAQVKIEFMFDNLKKLWSRLDMDEEYQSNFIQNHSGVGRKTVVNIQAEIQRCEELRRELVEPLIKKTRSKIDDLCIKLCYTEEQREKHMHRNRPSSEDLLDLLEIELGQLEIVYDENGVLLEVISKQRDMYERKLELEEAAKDKARLFNNRGGQLLREEKERKTIEQTFPKLTKKLEDLLMNYEERMGTPFLYFGENLLLKIRDNREQENMNRPSKILKSIASPVVREKRKMVLTTPKSESKRLKLASSTTSLASSASKLSNKSSDGRGKTRGRIALFKNQDTSVASSYSLFQEEIEEKKRSMCNSERKPLKEVNSPVYPFLSSPSNDSAPRFQFRTRSNQPSKDSQNKPNSKLATPLNNKRNTPRDVLRSTTRLATPKLNSTNRTCTPGMKNLSKTRTFFETPKAATTRSTSKPQSLIKPAKFHFNI